MQLLLLRVVRLLLDLSLVIIANHLSLRFIVHRHVLISLNQVSLFGLNIPEVSWNDFGLVGLELPLVVLVLVQLPVANLVVLLLSLFAGLRPLLSVRVHSL